jgi:hypothetical protein
MRKIRTEEEIETEQEIVSELCSECKKEIVTIYRSRNFDGSELVLVEEMWKELRDIWSKLKVEKRR